VAGDGSGTDVEPVDVLGRHLLGGTGLDGIDPTCSEAVLEAVPSLVAYRRSGELTGHRELALTLQERRVGRCRLLALRKTTQQMPCAGKLTDKLVSLYTGSNMISKIPSSEIFRPPHACSLHLPGCCCDGHGVHQGRRVRLGQRRMFGSRSQRPFMAENCGYLHRHRER
jgi:hypothetical protein